MKDVHTKKNAMKWLEGQIISYLYGGIDSAGLTRGIARMTREYGIDPELVRSLIDRTQENEITYYGGRYRLAYAAIGRRPGAAQFVEAPHRNAIVQCLNMVADAASLSGRSR